MIQPQSIDMRDFTAYEENLTATHDNPFNHYTRIDTEFPKSLLGYQNTHSAINSRTQQTDFTIRLNEIPSFYLDATAAHIGPIDYLSHHLLPHTLKQGHITTLTLDPAPGYMNSAFFDDVHNLVKGLTAFLTSEEKITSLYQGRCTDLWDMAEDLAACGCDILIIKRGAKGQLLYDSASKTRWIIPAYPVEVNDPTGAGDSFCGGFLAGYRTTYDPLQAALYGNISASMTVEGSKPFFALNALPGLANARLEKIQSMPKKM